MRIHLHPGKDNYLTILQYIIFGSAILYFGRNLFIPLSLAALISFVLYPVCVWLEKKGVGRVLSIVISLSLMIIILTGIMALLVQQFVSFLGEWPAIQGKLSQSIKDISQYVIDYYGVTKQQQQDWLRKIADQSSGGLLKFIQQALSASMFSVVLLVLIPIYAALILYYRHLLVAVTYRIFNSEKKENIRGIILLTIDAYYNFIKGMAIVYFIVAVLNSIGLLLLGVPHAILFGFIAAILTFIPYVGIMVGSLLPISMAWITYNSIWYPLGVVGVFTLVQYLEANIIFPLAVSNRLKVNTLATIIAIVLGGILWGVTGMILFVPFLAIVKLIADHHPKMKTISMLLGTDSPSKNY